MKAKWRVVRKYSALRCMDIFFVQRSRLAQEERSLARKPQFIDPACAETRQPWEVSETMTKQPTVAGALMDLEFHFTREKCDAIESLCRAILHESERPSPATTAEPEKREAGGPNDEELARICYDVDKGKGYLERGHRALYDAGFAAGVSAERERQKALPGEPVHHSPVERDFFIWRDSFRWKRLTPPGQGRDFKGSDTEFASVISNAYDSFSVETVCRDNGWEILREWPDFAIVRKGTGLASPAGGKP